MVKNKKLSLVVSFDETNSYEYLTDVLMQILGYEVTQAANCAGIIFEKGEYVVKSFSLSELSIAEAFKELLLKHGLPAQLINSKK